MSSVNGAGSAAAHNNPHRQAGWEAALREIQHQAAHLEARGARSAVTLFDAIRIARAGGLDCQEHTAGSPPPGSNGLTGD